MSNIEPKKAYVYQPGGDGDKIYGVAGIKGDPFLRLKGLTKKDATEISRLLNESPGFEANIARCFSRLFKSETS